MKYTFEKTNEEYLAHFGIKGMKWRKRKKKFKKYTADSNFKNLAAEEKYAKKDVWNDPDGHRYERNLHTGTLRAYKNGKFVGSKKDTPGTTVKNGPNQFTLFKKEERTKKQDRQVKMHETMRSLKGAANRGAKKIKNLFKKRK